jgi:hypothetical protein
MSNEDGDEIYPRNWKKMGLIVPKVIKKKQRRPCFTFEVINHVANSPAIKPQMRIFSSSVARAVYVLVRLWGAASRRLSTAAPASSLIKRHAVTI